MHASFYVLLTRLEKKDILVKAFVQHILISAYSCTLLFMFY